MTIPYKILIIIAMIPVLFAFSVADEAYFTSHKSTAISKVAQIKRIDAKTMILAKGQNHLPKRHNNKYDNG